MSQLVSPSPAVHIGGYRILNKLAGSRSLFEAEEPESARLVLLKTLELDPADSLEFLEQAAQWTQLSHDHLVPMLDAGDADGTCFYVVDLLQGESLQSRLKREHRLPLSESLRIGRELAAALAYLHSNNLIHRDVCPTNVWLDQDGRARLMGGGCSPVRESGTLLNRLGGPGTPGYQAPEQVSGEAISTAADLFSLGCVLYEMTTGEAAFRGETTTALDRAVVFEDPTPAKQINPDVSDELSGMIARLLSKLPDERRSSAAEIEKQLGDWIDPAVPTSYLLPPDTAKQSASRRILEAMDGLRLPPMATVVTTPRVDVVVVPATRPKKKRGWFADAVAAILLIAGAFGLYLWWKASHEQPPESPPINAQP